MTALSLFFGTQLPAAATDLLVEHGFLPSDPPPPPPPSAAPAPEMVPLTPIQGQILKALTARPLNHRQSTILEIYWRAGKAGEPMLSIDEVGRRLAMAQGIPHKAACDFVKGSLRSFGRRLLQTLKKVPVKFGHDRHGGGVADEIPMLALLNIGTGPYGESHHRLTNDGMVAVAAALGLNAQGVGAGDVATGDPALDDLAAMVTLGMSRLSAALLIRVQKSMQVSMDEAIQSMTAKAGAG